MKFLTSVNAIRLLWFFTLQILFCVICATRNSKSSWAKLQISPDTLSSMPYGNFRVKIYEHSNNHKSTTSDNRKRYFYSPIALLDHKSATSKFNNATKEAEMRFRIEMWNDHVQNEVVNYLPPIVGHEVKSYQVQIISFEQVLLATTKSSTINPLSTDWHPYALEESLWFTLTCFQQKDCDHLKDIMHQDPVQFHHLKLFFSLSSQTSQTKETVIRIENVVSGKMMSNLLQKFQPGKDPLLTAKDENKLLSEMTTNVMVETFDDSDVVSRNSETQIYTIMKNLLVSSRSTISKQNDKMWKSVFWNDDNYRPDKSTKQLNEFYRKQDRVTKRKIKKAFKNTNLVSAGGSGWGVTLSALLDFSREGSKSKGDVEKLYQESKDHVEWNGRKFVPKPLSLSRINLGNLRDGQKFHERKVRVRYSTAVLSTPIHFPQFANMSNTNEWIELKSELKELKFQHEKLERDFQATNNDLSELRKELEDSVTPDISFYGYRMSNFDITDRYVPFDRVELNNGIGLNEETGIFTTPRAGTYFFTFHGRMDPSKSQTVYMKLNGIAKTVIWNGANTKGDSFHRTSTMSIVLSLNIGDEVGVYLGYGYVMSYSCFSGILVRRK